MISCSVRAQSASSMTHFVTSAAVLIIALLGGFINFHLIALPMSEMVGATSHVGPVRTSDIAALVIITTEIAMGLFLMETLRITRLFPVIGRMDDVLRVRMMWISLGILAVLAHDARQRPHRHDHRLRGHAIRHERVGGFMQRGSRRGTLAFDHVAHDRAHRRRIRGRIGVIAREHRRLRVERERRLAVGGANAAVEDARVGAVRGRVATQRVECRRRRLEAEQTDAGRRRIREQREQADVGADVEHQDRKSTRLNSSHMSESRMPSSA